MAAENGERSLATLSTLMAARKTIQSIGSDPQRSDGTVGGEDTDVIVKPKLSLVGLFCLTAFFAAFVSFYIVPVYLVDFASITLLLLAPLAAWQKHQLRKLGGMRGQQNVLRKSANRLTKENRKLASSLNQLDESIDELQHVEDKLTTIAESSGMQVERLTDIVQENGEVQVKIKRALRIQVMQQIMTACLQSDNDRDFELGPNEVKLLEMRLSSIPGIEFHQENFEAFLKSDQGTLTLADVSNIARHLDNPDIPSNERLVSYATKKLVKKRPGLFSMGSAVLDLVP